MIAAGAWAVLPAARTQSNPGLYKLATIDCERPWSALHPGQRPRHQVTTAFRGLLPRLRQVRCLSSPGGLQAQSYLSTGGQSPGGSWAYADS